MTQPLSTLIPVMLRAAFLTIGLPVLLLQTVGTVLAAETASPSLDELYGIVLQQQETIDHQQKTIDYLTKLMDGLHQSKGVGQAVGAQKPDTAALMDRFDAVDEKLKSLTSSPTNPASTSVADSAQSRGPAKKREAVDLPGFYVTVQAEYAIPEDIKVASSTSGLSGNASLSDGVNLGFAVGYRINEHFRGDIEVGRRTHDLLQVTPEEGRSRGLLGQAELYTASLNGYFDFPKFASLKLGKTLLRPYIGAGIGAGYLRANDVAFDSDQGHRTRAVTDSIWLPMGQLMAGFSYKLTPGADLDLGYRFFALGDLSGTVNNQSGNSTVFKSHNVKAGLRFSFN